MGHRNFGDEVVTGTAAKMAALPVNAASKAAGDNLTGNAAILAAQRGALTGNAAFQAAQRGALTGNAAFQAAQRGVVLTGNAAILAAQAVEFHDAMSDAQRHFASCFDTVAVTRYNLPHWGIDGAVVFVTFRLADSLPASILAKWQEEKKTWLAQHPEPWTLDEEREYSTIFSNRMERWLDNGHGSCILARQDCRKVVSDALEHFNGVRYRLHSYVVMPNHVHVLLDLPKRDDLSRVLHSWKSFTAKALNKLTGAAGMVWMRDYYDRIVRNGEHYGKCVAYIRKNAVSAAKMAALPVSGAAKMAALPVSGAAKMAALPVSGAAKMAALPVSGAAKMAALPVSGTAKMVAVPVNAASKAAGDNLTGNAAFQAARGFQVRSKQA